MARMIRVGNDIGVEVDLVAHPVGQLDALAGQIDQQRIDVRERRRAVGAVRRHGVIGRRGDRRRRVGGQRGQEGDHVLRRGQQARLRRLVISGQHAGWRVIEDTRQVDERIDHAVTQAGDRQTPSDRV